MSQIQRYQGGHPAYPVKQYSDDSEKPAAKKEELPSYAWPGGYPILYHTKDGGTLCPDCANGKNGSEASKKSSDPQWRIVAHSIHWEGQPESCDHCNKQVESAYGDPEEGK